MSRQLAASALIRERVQTGRPGRDSIRVQLALVSLSQIGSNLGVLDHQSIQSIMQPGLENKETSW